MNSEWRRRYLALLGVEDRTPSLDNLAALTHAHRSIVFENVTSLLRRHRTPEGLVPAVDQDVLLSSWETRSGGGVCYEVTSMFGRLLAELGYNAHPVLGRISFPGAHQALSVEVDGAQYIVDSGCGAPLFEPVPVETPFEVAHAGLRYRFGLDSTLGKLIQHRWIDAAWTPFTYYDLAPGPEADYEAAYQRHHALPGESFVMRNLTLVHCTEDEVLRLRDHEFTRYTNAAKVDEEIYGLARYRELIADAFGLPGMDVEAGLLAWSHLTAAKI